MSIRRLVLGTLGLLLAVPVLAQMPPDMEPTAPAVNPVPRPALLDLGDGRYQLGPIILHKTQRWFEVNGRVLRRDPPLEYLAVAPGGMKGYESLLELDSGGAQFNLACILIGLERSSNTGVDPWAAMQSGQAHARLSVAWSDPQGRRHDRPATDLLAEQGRSDLPNDWRYIGSGFTQDNGYLAEIYGTLIGFARDVNSVIEHRTGLGVGNYGSVGANMAVAPPEGTPVLLRVQFVPAAPAP